MSENKHTEKYNSEGFIKESEQILNHIQEAVFFVCVEKNGSFCFQRNNKQHQILTGLTLENLRGKTPHELFDKKTADQISENCEKCRRLKDIVEYEATFNLSKNRYIYHFLLSPIIEKGEVTNIVGSGRDITRQKLIEEKIRYLSFRDHLTELFNRAYMEEEMFRLDTRRQLPIGIILADLNGLKLVNDTYGHNIGDEMLKQTAEILSNSCRKDDIIARWGGDEFVILLPKTGMSELEVICQRIMYNYQDIYVKDIPISLALGYAVKKNEKEEIKEVLKTAEDNMYKQKLEESRAARSNLLNSLLKTLEQRSFETKDHIRKMLLAALTISKKLGLPESELNRLKLLITLHDIGKINISQETLTKKDRLTNEEWEIIKEHPEIGYRIALATEEFAHVAEDILAHHERWDGKGYPRGLKGKEIPLLARITAIADAYDIMSSGRPHKNPMSREEIINELKNCAGTQFDPELVEIFVKMLNAGHHYS